MAEKKRQEEEMYEMKKNYSSLQEQVNEYKSIILNLHEKLQSATREAHDIEQENLCDKDSLLDNIRSQDKELKFYQGLVGMMLRPEQVDALRE